jgi:DHA1 family bicyclomycin/chloramphenicol resistance-like MFS transporter
MIGGVLQTVFGWRASFVLLLIFAAVAVGTVAARLLPETLHTSHERAGFACRPWAALYRSVLVHRGFLANLGILTTTFVGLFAWVSGAPIVMQGAQLWALAARLRRDFRDRRGGLHGAALFSRRAS